MASRAVPVLLLAALQLSLLHSSHGECLYSGMFYMNNTVWQPDACTVCTCHDLVPVCQAVRCSSPRCNYNQGEHLLLPQGACCPVCVSQKQPCQFRGQSVPHNTEWMPSTCTTCYCDDGQVRCGNVTCQAARCKPGQLEQSLPGQCCPKCLPAGRSCVDKDGERHVDGSEWEPLACTKCVCRDGQIACYPMQCPALLCPEGQKAERAPGSCCPTCTGTTCYDHNQRYKDGAHWQRDACTHCVCLGGFVECHSQTCVPSPVCPQGQVLQTRPGECCPECVTVAAACMVGGRLHYHGDLWNVSSCEFCFCKHGHRECRHAACAHVTCRQGEILEQKPGDCCPSCSRPLLCDFAGTQYQAGDTWHPDPCTVCDCRQGEVLCYQKTCPMCPDGMAPVLQPAQCCGSCQTVNCAESCSACLPSDPRHCTQCTQPGKLVQDGDCVDMCRDGYFPSRDNTCESCHDSCATCLDASEFHCSSCPPGSLWRDGQCVASCGSKHFVKSGRCYECHPSCRTCFGPEEGQCLSCAHRGQLLLKGSCVDDCGPHFFQRDQECHMCPPSCKACLPDRAACASCPDRAVLHNGQCLSACPRGFHPNQFRTCSPCHPSCASCWGGSAYECEACHQRHVLRRGQCASLCPGAQFMTSQGNCQACGRGCRFCYPSSEGTDSVCGECLDSSKVPYSSSCSPRCPAGFYLHHGVCRECDADCMVCEAPGQCTKCFPPHVLASGHCVRVCPLHSYSDSTGVCRPCAEHCLQCQDGGQCEACDSSTYLQKGSCVSQCDQTFLPDDSKRLCEANEEAPVLQVAGPVQVRSGGVEALPAGNFLIMDTDTPAEKLRVYVRKAPRHGHLVRTANGEDHVLDQEDFFTVKDIETGKVRFVHDRHGKWKDTAEIQVSDGHLYSDQAQLTLQALPPQPLSVAVNQELQAAGGEATVLSPATLDLQSSVGADQVNISVLEGPRHGRLVLRGSNIVVTTFTLKDLRAEAVAYQHWANQSQPSDQVLLQASDGFFQLNLLLEMAIRPKGSKVPILINNRGGQVQRLGLMVITKDMLQATVPDPASLTSTDVIYTLVPSVNNPKEGEILMVVPVPASGPGRGWEELGGGRMGAKMFRFLQRDIDEGRIWYRHLGGLAPSDVFTFEVADAATPPHVLRGQSFHVAVVEERTEALAEPTLAPGVRLGMTVLENQVVPVSAASLAYQDADTEAGRLVYTLTTLLGEGEGTLEHVAFPFKPVLKFTQDDVDNQRILYRPPQQEIGAREKEVSFSFVVSDGGRIRRQPEQKFTIRILPVNNAAPQFHVERPSLTVAQGAATFLDPDLFKVSDPDTASDQLRLTLTRAPVAGRLEHLENGAKVTVRTGDAFAYASLASGQFQYVHGGSDTQLEDVLEVTATDGVHQTRQQVAVSVLPVDKLAPFMLPAASCHLNLTEGETVILTREDLSFGDGEDSDDNINVVLATAPLQGQVLLGPAPDRRLSLGQSFTQQDINLGHVSYKAADEVGSQPVTELLYFNVSDSSGNTLPNQVLSVLTLPWDNQLPLVAVGWDLEVDEGGEVILDPELITVTDVDSPLSALSFVVDSLPSFGFLRNTRPEAGSERDGQAAVSGFSMQDLLDGHVRYVQADHRHKEPAWDGLLFHVTDGANVSPTLRLNVSINLLNDEAPLMVTEQLFVQEGRVVALTNASMYVVDIDTDPEDLVFTLDLPPVFGSLKRKDFVQDPPLTARILGAGDKFTYEDILQELIIYHHNDDEVTTDTFRLHLSDGDFNDTKALSVIVGLINDETPRMTVNRGLRVQAGSTTAIKAKDLRASDVDSDDEKIIYTLTSDPSAGKLQFHKGDLVYLLTAQSQANTFTQQHVDKGYIEYVHSPGEMTGNIVFKFKLSDPEGNDLIDQSFYVTVLEDRIPPEELANREFTVTEGERRKITTDFLSFTDADSEPGLLRYIIVEGPSLGHLELTAKPGVPVVEFTQAELAANSVVYVHDSVEEEYMDTFTFIVSDGTNEVVKTFFIKISPVDDSIPLLTSKGLRVQEGVRKLITEFELKAVDKDTREDQIVFTVVQPPAHGLLQLQRGEELRPAVSFSMRDIYENQVSYLHDGSETLEDNFSFTVSDGTNSLFAMQQDAAQSLLPVTSPQEFKIEVLPMDDGSPILSKNLGLQFLESSGFDVSNLITERELLAEDEDTKPADLQFVVTTAPGLGRLERVGNPGRPIQAFTQEDISSGFVRYVLTQRTEETQDSFTFDLVDGKPNLVPNNVFHVMWSRVAFEQTQYNVSETAGVIRVPVVRVGNLKQYSIVTCRTVEGTATSRPQAQQPGTHDFLQEAKQVQFDDWQDMKTCSIIINDDSTFEGPETFYVELVSPTYTLLGGNHKIAVTVYDTEDEPVIQFSRSVFYVNETDSYVMATVTRTGDLSKTVSAICSTQSMTAVGSSLTRLESGSDYISRGETNSNRVVFPPGITTAACDVKILDDSEFESAEQFELILSEPSLPGALGPQSKATVIIEGPNDESVVFLSQSEYHFDENYGTVEVEVLREGSDLTHTTLVWCATRLSNPPSATPGQDYIPSSSQITFGPGQSAEKCQLNILDDEYDPRLEGNETFVVFLSSAVGSSLAEPYFASVVIHDSQLDVPQMTFVQDQYLVDEKNGTVNVTVLRSGDLSFPSSVICYSRQGSALVMADFQERVLTQDSRITFLPGERAKNCSVQITDDEEFEPEETFTLRLAEPQGTELCPATLGVLTSVTVTITNHDDVPTLQLERAAYSINEPSAQDQVATVTVVVVRSGDVNQTSSVRCSTRDGSAQSGIDYNPKSLVLTFEPGQRRVEFPVDILYNDDVEWHESFSVQLGPADPVGAMLGPVAIATITILDNEVSGSLILPAAPVVVSLMHFDDAEQGVKIDPSPGYPLVCITPCNVQYPTYAKTHGLCQESAINQSSILYRWEVAMPEDEDGSRPPFVQVSDRTLYTSVDKMVLDAIYFRPRFRVRCVAQPLHENGNPGVPLRSRPVTIGSSNALCSSPAFGPDPYGYQAQSFLASLDYRGPEDVAHPNTIHIAVKVPHQDGMLPLLSTHPLHNLRFLLSEPVYRQQHVCSSLLGPQERAPLVKDGFLNSYDSLEPPYGPGYDFPYQFDETLREPRTLNLYQHLNLKSCVWTFEAWYHMTELIDICGGQIVSDFEVKDAAKTHLTVRVPLYVSYLYASAPVGWGSLEHHTQIEFSFYYDAILWGRGLETEGHSGGKIQVMRILIGDDGKLVIEFRTQAKFRGLFVLKHHTLPEFSSRLLPPASLAISFDLQLLWGQQTFDSPYQLWRATSKFNLKDYTGKYVIELIPCKVKPTQAYLNSDPLPCSAEAPQRFEVPIAFQQTNRPVPLVYSLDTEFQLTNNRKMFLLDPRAPNMDDDLDFTGSFAKGEKIYGRVLWSPKQDLKTAYRLTIEKVYLCTGMDGYIPTYDPTGDVYKEGPQYGCLQPSPNLRHRFLIIDRKSPDVAQRDFQEIPFQAELARDNADFHALTLLPGVDGFALSADPLYKVDPGHQWYLQVVYMIGPADKPHFRLRRASGLTATGTSLQSRQRRAVGEDDGWLERRESRNGTNMQELHLAGTPDGSGAQQGSLLPIVLPVVLALVVVLVVVVIIVVVRRRRRRGASKQMAKDTKGKPPINIQNNLLLLHQEERMGKSQKSLHRLSVRLSESSGDLKKIGISTGSMKRTQVKEINLKNDYGKNLDGGTEV